ncbi:MAG TPA: TRAP transporter TatT component family protein [Blastocatellia bacterium]|nr:TRAP transporter TatT component family protein [Blastocatellia bacterium]
MSVNPDGVEGHFWLGVNLALFAEVSWGISGIRAIRRARRELLRAIEISASYHGAGPLRVLGRLEHKAPRFLGGSRERSRQYLDRALAIAPSNSVTLLYRAELALDCGERDAAIALLEQIISKPVGPDWEFENLRDRKLAQAMLERLRK